MQTKNKSLLFFLLAFCLIVTPVAMAQALTVTTNMDVYAPGETIQVTGTAVANSDVTVQLLNPNGQLVDIDYVKSGADGAYALSFKVPTTIPSGQWVFGTYIVKAFMGAQTATKTITIQQKISVTGKVVDSAGIGISGATVTIGTATGTTAADGTFTVYLASEGTYTVKVTKANYYPYTGSVTAAIGVTNMGTITLTSYEDKIAEMNKTINDLKATISSLNKTVSDLKTTVNTLSALQTTVNDLKSKVDSLSSQVSSLSGQISALSGLSSTVNDLKSKVDSLSSQVSSLSGSLQSANSEITNLRNSLQSANNEISSLKSTVQQLQTTVAVATDLKSSVDALKSSVDALQATTSQLPILYALAFISIILAVIAIILVYRKIAA